MRSLALSLSFLGIIAVLLVMMILAKARADHWRRRRRRLEAIAASQEGRHRVA